MNIQDALTTQTIAFVSDLIKNTFIPRIVKYINERESNDLLTVDELTKVLTLPKLNTHKSTNKKCIWEFKRGKYRGNVCDKQTVDGSDYCSSCIKRLPCPRKQSSNKDLNVSNTMTLSDMPECNGEPLLNAQPYDKERGLFKCDGNSYIFRFLKIDNSKIMDMYIVGKTDDYGKLVKLSDEEFEQAVEEGYLVERDYQ